MAISISINAGSFIGYRQIVITLAGYVGGPVTAAIAAAIGIVYRIYLGGCGAAAGITVLIFFGFFGCYLRGHYTPERIAKPATLLTIGFAMSLIYLFIMVTVNGIVNSLGRTIELTKHLLIPMIIYISAINFIVFKISFFVYTCLTYKSFSEAILNSSSLDIGAFNQQGETLFASKGLMNNRLLKVYVANLIKKQQDMAKEQNTRVSIAADECEKMYSINISACPLPQQKMGICSLLH
jgi:LytS/YehU family sensor histidine kinase